MGRRKFSSSHGFITSLTNNLSKSLPPHIAIPPCERSDTDPSILSAMAISKVPPPRSNIKKIPSELSDLITLITAAIGSCIRATFPMPAIEAAFNVAVFCI